MTNETTTTKFYTVAWTEYHALTVEADSAEEAEGIAHDRRGEGYDTFNADGEFEVIEVDE